MGKAVKKVTKAVTKVAKKAANVGKNFVQSAGKAAETAVSGTAKLATGDISGALDKYGRTAVNLANVSTGGSVDLSGRNNGVINIDTPEVYNAVSSLVKGEKSSGSTTTADTDTETDGLLQYVSDLRTRKARRSRASTNNTSGGSSSDSNKLSGTTALGV